MATLDELTTAWTVDVATTKIYTEIEARGLATSSWKPGAVTRTIIAVVAVLFALLTGLIALIAKANFLSLSSGAWLTLLARYAYNVERDVGAFATGTVRLTNGGAGVFSGAAGDLVVAHATTGKMYRSTASYSLGAGPGTFVDVAVQAVELGTASNAAANTITTLVTSLLGVTCTNAAALTGSDEETDAALQLRCNAKTGSLSPNGPGDAYAYVARSTKRADGTSIGVSRIYSVADGNGTVNVYLGTPSGGVTGTIGDTATDLGLLDYTIQTQVVPQAVTAVVASATAKTIAISAAVYVRNNTGLSQTQISDRLTAAVQAYLAARPIGGDRVPPAGGFVYRSGLIGVLGGEFLDTIKVDLTTPAADTAIAANEAPVLGTCSITVGLISGAPL